jgi:hypothetical protein
MIRVHSDCVFVQGQGDDLLAGASHEVMVEFETNPRTFLDPELVHHAAAAVLHYFKHELGRSSVSVGEFSMALERVLRGFGLNVKAVSSVDRALLVAESDLRKLACDSGRGVELIFFPRLRREVRERLLQRPRIIRFQGLRGCVKQLVGARRWTHRCQRLNDQIVDYLRLCWSSEAAAASCALVVE